MKQIPVSTYVAMMVASNLGWVVGTLLYHWVAR